MKNSYVILVILIFLSCFFTFCRTNPPSNVKIIEEKDPIVKILEEKDSMRLIHQDTMHNKTSPKYK